MEFIILLVIIALNLTATALLARALRTINSTLLDLNPEVFMSNANLPISPAIKAAADAILGEGDLLLRRADSENVELILKQGDKTAGTLLSFNDINEANPDFESTILNTMRNLKEKIEAQG